MPLGTDAYFVVDRSNFIDDIEKLHVKGYDASGKDDQELEEDEEFSDDEKEEMARQNRRQQKRGANGEDVEVPTEVAAGKEQARQYRPRQRQGGRGAGRSSHGHALHPPGIMQHATMPMWPPPNAWGSMPWGAAAGQMHWLGGPLPSGQMPPYGMVWPAGMPSYGTWPHGQMPPNK